jgi:hypothetical protein
MSVGILLPEREIQEAFRKDKREGYLEGAPASIVINNDAMMTTIKKGQKITAIPHRVSIPVKNKIDLATSPL